MTCMLAAGHRFFKYLSASPTRSSARSVCQHPFDAACQVLFGQQCSSGVVAEVDLPMSRAVGATPSPTGMHDVRLTMHPVIGKLHFTSYVHVLDRRSITMNPL